MRNILFADSALENMTFLREAVMSKQTLGLIAAFLGILVMLVSALADPLGLGQDPGLGWRQGLGLIVGVAAIWIGLRWRRKARSS